MHEERDNEKNGWEPGGGSRTSGTRRIRIPPAWAQKGSPTQFWDYGATRVSASRLSPQVTPKCDFSPSPHHRRSVVG